MLPDAGPVSFETGPIGASGRDILSRPGSVQLRFINALA
jgi:hypothetical protein